MIVKFYQIKDININKDKFILFYGVNEGLKKEEISKLTIKEKRENISKYEEKEVIENSENFLNSIFSKSLFEDKKVIIINQASDRILNLISEIIEKDISDISIILNANNLEKKSKLRTFFEKNKETICTAFYADTTSTLLVFAQNFLLENNIKLSQENLNLIINKCNGDRGILKNELEKIRSYALGYKNITHKEIIKLINLIENYSISELVDNCLAKNIKKTLTILNENNFSKEDSIVIIKTFLFKLKKLLKLVNEYHLNKNLSETIQNAKPPIFWKDKEIIQQQIIQWNLKKINEAIIDLVELELQIKKNYENAIFTISNFIINSSKSKTNNSF
jgi:DNA polymerase-3 subunit delta